MIHFKISLYIVLTNTICDSDWWDHALPFYSTAFYYHDRWVLLWFCDCRYTAKSHGIT